jgi:hypothetical protein
VLQANRLVTLPGGTQQTASTSATVSGLQRIGHGAHARTILNLNLGPVHLDILGVVVDLQPVTIKVQAIPGRGQILGNLLSSPGLHGQRLINTLAGELNTLINAGDRLANLLTPSIPLGSGATLNTQQLSQDLTSAGVTAGTGACPILSLDTGPIDLNLLGLDVSIPTGIHLKVTAIPSGQTVNGDSGGLLGSLLCQLANALNNPSQVAGFLSAADLSNILNGLANPLQSPAASTAPLSAGLSRGLLNQARANAASALAPTNILSLTLGPINLNLLGLQVTTSPICLKVSAQRGPGNLLGNLLGGVLGQPGISLRGFLNALGNAFTGLGGLQGNLGGSGTTGLLGDPALLQSLINELVANLSSTTNPTTSCPILHLSLGPLHLNLLGLVVDLNNCANPPGPVTVDITAIPGPGNLLGNLLCDLAGLAM